MATTEAQVRKYLDPEEPKYSEAAAALGPDALPVLQRLVREADPLLASKAAYLASLIPDAQAGRVLEEAAHSDHATVRIAAAAGLAKRADIGDDVAAELMNDPDPGVRKMAAKTARSRARAARPEAPPPDTVPSPETGGGEGEGGGDVGPSGARAVTDTSLADPESGGGGDLGGGVGRPAAGAGDAPDGGGSFGESVGDDASTHGGGSLDGR
jgi:hypothetical protein